MTRSLTIGVVAGEVSGDLLGADLIAALKRLSGAQVQLVGVGGEALKGEGLQSLFDYSELSVMGLTQVIARLPLLVRRIGQTARALVAARPDIILLIDSPDFTHRVARRVRAANPDIPVVKYVCPSVWAWKEYRAPAMRAYVDHVLALLPFEPDVMRRLSGPPTTFVGHRLTVDPNVLAVRAARTTKAAPDDGATLLLLPGSRGSEVRKLLPVMREAAETFIERNGKARLLLPTVPRMEGLVRAMTADWPHKPEISARPDFKWTAFAKANAAVAASGTVLLELALCGVPVVSIYKSDWLIRLIADRIRIWSVALPNLVADYTVVPEYFDAHIRAGRLVRWLERLSGQTPERQAMLAGFDDVWTRLQVSEPPGEAGARIVLELLSKKTGQP